MTPLMRMHQQNPTPKPAVSREMRKKIRSSMAAVVGSVRPRPEPRDFWDDVSSARAEFRHAWLDKTVIKCREALEAARTQGAGAQGATLDAVKQLYADLLAESIAGYEIEAPMQFKTLLCELAHDDALVMTTAADTQCDPTEGNIIAVRLAAMRSIHTSEEVLERASAELARTHQPFARVAAR